MTEPTRPRTRGECLGGRRPCPWVSCIYHLYIDVNPATGAIQRRSCEPWEMEHTCALDVADEGGSTLEEIGQLLKVTRERIRQLEFNALRKLKQACLRAEIEPNHVDDHGLWDELQSQAPGDVGLSQGGYRCAPPDAGVWRWHRGFDGNYLGEEE